MARLFSIVFWIWVALVTTLLTTLTGLVALVAAPFDPTRRRAQQVTALWGRSIMLAHPGWRLRVEGKENLPPAGAFLLASNHSSLTDIFAMFYLRVPFKWVAKESLFRIPVLGWAMTWAGYIPLMRDERRSIRHTFVAILRCLKQGVPVALFPEGTRSRDGQLGPFKAGAFRLAIKARVPIVPVAITGTREVVVPDSWILSLKRDQRVRVKVFPPIPPPQDEPGAADRLSDQVREVIASGLGGS